MNSPDNSHSLTRPDMPHTHLPPLFPRPPLPSPPVKRWEREFLSQQFDAMLGRSELQSDQEVTWEAFRAMCPLSTPLAERLFMVMDRAKADAIIEDDYVHTIATLTCGDDRAKATLLFKLLDVQVRGGGGRVYTL